MAEPNPSLQRAIKVWGTLRAQRQQVLPQWTSVAAVIEPWRQITLETGSIYPQAPPSKGIQDSTLRESLELNASGQFYLNFPIGTQWLRFKNSASSKRRKSESELQKISEVVQEAINNSNFASEARAFLKERTAYGTAFMLVGESSDGSPFFKKLNMSLCGVSLEQDGAIQAISLESWMTLDEIAEQYGENKLPKEVNAQRKADFVNDRHRVILVLERQKGGRYSMIEFVEKWGTILNDGTHRNCPIVVSRYQNMDTSSWGIGIGINSLPDHNELTLLVQTAEAGCMMETFPPVLVPSTYKLEINLAPGSRVPFNPSNPNAIPKPLRTGSLGTHLLDFLIDRYTKKIQDACHVDLFAPLLTTDRIQDMKATVANIIESYASRTVSDVYARLITEFVQPSVSLVADMLGYDTSELNLIVCSPMQVALDASKMETFERVVNALSPLVQAEPALAKKVLKPVEISRSIMFSNGLPTSWVVTDQELQEMEMEEKEMQSAQMASQLALTASEVSKNVNRV